MNTHIDTVVVIGAAGFISQYLTPALAHVANNIVLIDPKPIPDRLINVLTELPHSYYPSLLEYNPSASCTLVSIAGVTDVDEALHKPDIAFSHNINLALEMAEWLRTKSPTSKLVYMSSDEVLGVSFEPLPENTPLCPTQPYAASKAAAEILLHNYRDVYNLDIVTLRSCNLIGGLQKAKKIIPISVNCIKHNKAIPVYGDGSHRREWLSVEDICTAILKLIQSPTAKGVYQASSHISLSINEVIEIIEKSLGVTARKVTTDYRAIHDVSYAMDTKRLKKLGWAAKIDPKDAIAAAAKEMFLSGDWKWLNTTT